MKTLNNASRGLLLVALMCVTGLLTACAQATTTGAQSTTASGAKVASPDAAKAPLLQTARQMMEKMKKLQTTGDPDFDYAFRAKVHTQGAIDLLNQEIQNGKNDSLKQAAQTMLAAAKADMGTIDATLKQLKPTRPNQAFASAQSRNVEAMALKMQQGGAEDKLMGDFDKNFATILLEHRQDAIDMANTYLQYGNNGSLKNIAQQTVTKAQQDMQKIKGLVK